MPNDKKVKGIVTGALFGICTNIAYEDGCQRPGDKGLVTNSVVISETSTVNGICEHTVLKIREPFTPAPKPEPIRPTRTVQPEQRAPLTVDQIGATAEQRKAQPKQPRLAVPREDAPVSQQIIEAAKKVPKLRSDFSTMPAAARAAMPAVTQAVIEHRLDFDGDLGEYTAEELAELRGSRTEVESISDGEPMSPFDNSFSASPTAQHQQHAPRRGEQTREQVQR